MARHPNTRSCVRRKLRRHGDALPPSVGGVYTIRNTVTNERYIGSSRNMRDRIHNHRVNLNRGTHLAQKLQEAWDRQGDGAFVYEVLSLVSNPARLFEQEQFWLDHFRSAETGYNNSPTAGSIRGYKMPRSAVEATRARLLGVPRSDETKAKLREARKNLSPETIAKLVAAGKRRAARGYNMPVGPKRHSPETRAKMSATHRELHRQNSERAA